MSSKSGGAKKSGEGGGRLVAENRRARYHYEIGETFEAGLVLLGTEVKSLREGRANIAESYVAPEGGELWLINADIPEYSFGNRFNHEPRRRRKLLMHRREIARLAQAVQRQGMTIVPLKMYFNDRGIVKLLIGLARGRKRHDKRENEKRRDWQRQKARLLRRSG
ncbi:MAG TPA: SsrA-binding protein SmpB [Thermopetrobacter sp.]|nr:SsrA-binding protein SmpB [Thermopetrobacter sp.]